MHQHGADLFGNANPAHDRVVGKNDMSLPICDRAVASDEEIRRLCLKLWPEKGAAALRIAMYGGCDIRSAQRIVARRQGFSREVFTSLQASEAGEPFLKLAMSRSRAVWWAEFYQELELAAKEKKARALLREVRKAREVD